MGRAGGGKPLNFPGASPQDTSSPLPSPAQAPPLFISGETSVEDTPDLAGPCFLQGLCQNWEG